MSDSGDSDFISQSPQASTSRNASSRYAAGTVTVSRVWSGAEWVAELELQKGLKVQYRLVDKDNFYMDLTEDMSQYSML